MRAEEMNVVDAAITWYHARGNQDPDQVAETRAVLVRQIQNLIYSCSECNTDTHRCPGCGSPISHFASACPQCEDDSTSAYVKSLGSWETPEESAAIVDQNLRDAGRSGLTIHCGCSRTKKEYCSAENCHGGADVQEWEPATFAECLAGDRIRLNGEETTVIRSTRGTWHADNTDPWHPMVWTHEELRLELEANPQFIPYPLDMAIEILCTPARRGALALQKVFPGTTEVK